jgi:hypothetical protein
MRAELRAASAAEAHEAGLDRSVRRRRGVFYTPADLAGRLVDLALEGWPGDAVGADSAPNLCRAAAPRVCDPAAGGGAFLLAAADRLAARGLDRRTVVAELLWGADVDAEAVAIARDALAGWAGLPPGAAEIDVLSRHLAVADALTEGPAIWPERPPAGFDLVVGNPPFLGQLERRTARRADELASLRHRMGDVVAPYADAAALFLVEAVRLAAPGGQVVLVLPESVLSARDARPARAEVGRRAALRGCWTAVERVFTASVDVCAPVLSVAAPQTLPASGRTIRRWAGRAADEQVPVVLSATEADELRRGGSWSGVLVAAADRAAPAVRLAGDRGTLADLAVATAGFRDQFYGLVGHVVEATDGDGEAGARANLVTSGAVDPLHLRWGATPVRFGGARWTAPTVDLDALEVGDPRLSRWGRQRLVPKVLLATQTRVLEPVVDVDGRWWPSVPTIAITPNTAHRTERLWRLAAVLLAPPITAWALSRHRGAALDRDALKLSATEVLAVPLPADHAAWIRGAQQAAAAQAASVRGDSERWLELLDGAARCMTEAYEAPIEVFDWWQARRPGWR